VIFPDSWQFFVINAPERAALVDAWKQWMEEHLALTGKVPPGNEKGVTTWTERKGSSAKQDLRLTPGPHVKLNITLPQLIDKVVKDNKVVAFIKGSRTSPQCGFSHRVLTILNEHGIDYESVNVLDEEHNSGLREAIKVYSQWPTIPQIFVNGEFIGGADILEELATNGKVKEVFQQST
jgi:Grx4 family monothiol glutaredoxin